MEKQTPQQKKRGGYLDALLTGCPIAILATNADGIITFANKEACKLAEREIHELVGESIVVIYENMEAARETNRKLYMSGGTVHDHESKVKTKSGKPVPVRISASHLKDSAGNYIGAVGYFERYRPWADAEVKTKAYAEELEAKLAEWKDLGAPVFELYPGLATVVVVGRLDVGRCEQIIGNLLDHIKRVRSRVALIDLSAALADDADVVASQIVKNIRTIRLLGAECVLAGIQTSVAQAMEPLITDISSIKSYCSTEVALEAALKSLGFEIRKKD